QIDTQLRGPSTERSRKTRKSFRPHRRKWREKSGITSPASRNSRLNSPEKGAPRTSISRNRGVSVGGINNKRHKTRLKLTGFPGDSTHVPFAIQTQAPGRGNNLIFDSCEGKLTGFSCRTSTLRT